MALWKKIMIGLVAGVVTGLVVGPEAAQLKPIGTLFINLIRMLVVPLIFFSIVAGVTSLNDPKTMGRIGIKTVAIYMVSTLFAVSLGLTFGTVFTPGEGATLDGVEEVEATEATAPSALDLILGVVPTNPVQAMAEGNMLQIIFFAILFGIAMALTGDKAKPLIKLNEALAETMYGMTRLVMKFAPYGVFALMAWVTAMHGPEALLPLLKLVLVVFMAYICHMLVVYGVALGMLGNLSPVTFFKKVFEVQLVALTTSSSSATLPVTLRVTHEKMGVQKSVSSFVLPLGTTVNMDGSAIYHGVCTLFVAQAVGMELGMAEYLTVIMTSTLVSIGAAGVPSGGFTMLLIVFSSIGVPAEGILLIAAVERLLDMGRTVVNVTGDAMVSLLVAKSEDKLDEKVYHSWHLPENDSTPAKAKKT